MHKIQSSLLALTAALLTVPFLGCPLVTEPQVPSASEPSDPEPLDQLVARTLEQNLQRRQLSTDTQGAWQILHGVLAYGGDFPVISPSGKTSALEYALSGGAIQGFEPRLGDGLGTPSRPGLRMEMQPGSKVGQGHRDQWIAIFSQCDLPIDTEIVAGDHTFTMGDWLRQMEYDLPRNLELEFSWSLIALAAYFPTDHSWLSRDGGQYSVEDLVQSELEQSLPSSVCGGTHRLIGLSMALNRRRQEGRPVTGVWLQAEQELAESIESARRNQNPDGSFSIAYLHRPGWTRDLGETLGTTGHVLEFLSFAASDQTLSEPWVERSVRRLCQVLAECSEVDLECGVLYHALHGLREYQRRTDGSKLPDQGQASAAGNKSS